MAISEQDCQEMIDCVVKNKIIFGVGHVLLYSPYTQKIKEIIESGKIGKVVNIQHLVSNQHENHFD